MGITVLVPVKAAYTLYARGEVEAHAAVPGRGTYITFTGGSAVILFYKRRRHRRVYIVREAAGLSYYRAVRLPGVREKVGVLGKFRGRRVDLARWAYYNLEKINGFGVYRYGTRFWQRLCCLIDGYGGRHTGPVKSSLLELSGRYAPRPAAAYQEGEDDQGT
jgi:hypothetical protein